MTEATRKKALQKVDKFSRLVAYEDYLLHTNQTQLNQEHTNVGKERMLRDW